MARAILEPEKYHIPYQLEAMLNGGANSIRSGCDRDILIKAFQKVPFIVTFAINYDEVTMMSDIVFPDYHFLEHKYARFYIVSHQNIDDSIRGLTCVIGRNPAVEPLHNPGWPMMCFLKSRTALTLKGENGVNDYINRCFMLKGEEILDLNTKYGIEEIIDRRVKQIYGAEASFNALLKRGAYYRFDAKGKYGYNWRC